MLTVRFPSGLAVTYNDAQQLHYEPATSAWALYKDKACTQWVASVQISAGAIIECERPCSVITPSGEMLAQVAKELRAVQRKLRERK